MTASIRFVIFFLLFLTQGAVAQEPKEPIELLIRCDDIGMNHAVNEATKQLLESGLTISTSVMFACPWYQEAVDILKQYPNTSVGVHLTLNAEWRHYRWGPVVGAAAVPSLIDSVGYFFPTRASLFANEPKTEEVERELRAQIQRALRSGLRIDYLDYHMSAAVTTLDLREVVEKLAKEFGLSISRYFGEEDVPGVYRASVEHKKDTLLAAVTWLQPGAVQLLVNHIGLETPEMNTLVDMNQTGLPEMSKHRQAELRALLSPEFRSLLRERGIRLVTYRDLIRERGLGDMKRPAQTN
jgi:hypothetical protein